MNNPLKDLQDFIESANASNKSTEKIKVLRNYPQLQRLLKYVYNPFWQYYVTSKTCIARRPIQLEKPLSLYKHETIFDLLNDLKDHKITGHKALDAVNQFVINNLEYEAVIWLIIDCNLKTRTDAKIINKVFKGLIPQFNVALAGKYIEASSSVDWDSEKWLCSRKLDGLRCIVIVDEKGSVKCYSRTGNEFTALSKVQRAIESLKMTNKVFDGEICIINPDGSEDFSKAVSQVRSKSKQVQNPKYQIFDLLTLDEFNLGSSSRVLSERLKSLHQKLSENGLKGTLSVLAQIHLKSYEAFKELESKALQSGWEGLILRKDVNYEGKRTKNMLKVKNFQEDEFTVKRIESAPFRHIIECSEVESVMLSNIVIDYKGKEVSVGSGFKIDQRIRYHIEPSLIIGKQVTVQYFEESSNRNDNSISLRFPTIKKVWEEGARDV